MLIKLAGGFPANLEDIEQELKVGSPVLRYVLNESYDKGEVVEVNGSDVIVDFMDTVRSFEKASIGLVYGNGHDEHWAVFEEGSIIKTFQAKTTINPKIARLEDILDFDNWMI